MRIRINDVMFGIAGLALALPPLCRALRDAHNPGLLMALWLLALPFLLPSAFLVLVVAGTMLEMTGAAAARIWAAGRAWPTSAPDHQRRRIG